MQITKNTLWYGDCLDVLKQLYASYPHGFIDLIYIDPPFNSKRNYNILFESVDLSDTKAQREAFADTWSNIAFEDTLDEIKGLDLNLYNFLRALDTINISKSSISYLSTMALRIWYMHKLLKDTGSFYLHCDPTMSHYLKIVCDLVFGERNYRNEITWKRTSSIKSSQHKDRKFPNVADIILFYTKSTSYIFESDRVKIQFSDDEIIKRYPFIDEKGRYTRSPIFRSMGMGERPNLCYEYKGAKNPNAAGWKVSKERLIEIDNEGDLGWSTNNVPFRKFRPEHTKGFLLTTIWDDIEQTGGSERLGYPTQKPEALLERIIKASSNEGDIVADFFCGCGTSIAAANKLNRRWLGVDISHLAIKLILDRLTKPYEKPRQKEILNSIDVMGFPKDIASAKMLANETTGGRFKFQDWIIEVMLGGISNTRKAGDGGFDGYITFQKSEKEKGVILIEVKSGGAGVAQVRSFITTIQQQKADMGVFVCFDQYVSNQMLLLARQQGHFMEDELHKPPLKVQILTVEEILQGETINFPQIRFEQTTFKKATKTIDPEHEHKSLFDE